MTAAAPALFRLRGIEGLALGVLWLVMTTGGIVFREPAPIDALMMMVLSAALVLGIRIERGLWPPAILLAVYVAFEALGSAQAPKIGDTLVYSLVTLYLSASGLLIACLVAWNPARVLPVILSAIAVAALIATVAGIAGYFSLFGGADELFTKFGRAKGTFKDPNVFAPFLILPMMYAFMRLLTLGPFGGIVWTPVILALFAGLFLSFSRGAWLHAAVSSMVLLGFAWAFVPSRGIRARAVLVAAAGAAVLAFGITWALSIQEIGSLFAERASLEQSHDLGAQGRFAGQVKAVAVIVQEPFGIGTTAFERYHHEQPHNVYLNVFLNAGWVGGLAYLALVALTLARALPLATRPGRYQLLAIPIVACFLGLAVEGLIIDTDRWRHFYWIVGMIWGLSVADMRDRGPANAPAGTRAQATAAAAA